MGPSGRTRRGTRTRTARKTRSKKSELKRSTSTTTSPILKSNNKDQSEEEVVLNSPSRSSSNDDDFPKTEGIEFEAVDDDVSTSTNSTGCSTPKGRRFRIPEIRTCPPAPKKQRVISNCSIQRTPIAFFAPPDLELFFYLALRGISV